MQRWAKCRMWRRLLNDPVEWVGDPWLSLEDTADGRDGKSVLLHVEHADDSSRTLAQTNACLGEDALRDGIALFRDCPHSLGEAGNLELAEGRAIHQPTHLLGGIYPVVDLHLA